MGKKGEPEKTEAEVEAALRSNRGSVAMAAERLGLARQTIYERIEGSPHLQLVKREIEEAMLDAAEFGMSEMIDKLDGPMIRFALSTKGRNRGYVTRTESLDVRIIQAFISDLGNDPANTRRALAALGIEPARALDAGNGADRALPQPSQR